MRKEVVHAILALIILIGAVIIATSGLNVDIIYSKNVEIDIYVGTTIEVETIKELAKEVFPDEKIIVQEIELFEDSVAITMAEKSDEDLEEALEELNTKINETYDTENTVEDNITIIHNAKIRLSSIIKPYILPIIIGTIIILIYVGIRYRKLGMAKTALSYVLYSALVEAEYLSLIAITRFPVNRYVIPVGLALYIITVTVLSFKNEKKLIEK